MLSPIHIVFLVLLILLALVVFGPKRLPELGSSVGRALQEFKKASNSTIDEVRSVTSTVTSSPTGTVETKTTEVDQVATPASTSEAKPPA